jgi:hypothetical protein
MAHTTYNSPDQGPRTIGAGYLFGVPVKDMGLFATLLMGFASGFLAFFAATFVGIVSILFYNSTGHHTVDYAYSYTRVGLPIGLIVGVIALGYMGMLWIRRQTTRR